MDIFRTNGSFCKFYPNLPKTSFIHKMNENKAHTCNEHLLINRNETDHFVILPKATQNFLQFQNEQN